MQKHFCILSLAIVPELYRYMKLGFKVVLNQPLSLLPNTVAVAVESVETPPPTKSHLSIKVTTTTRNMDATALSAASSPASSAANSANRLTVDCSSSSSVRCSNNNWPLGRLTTEESGFSVLYSRRRTKE